MKKRLVVLVLAVTLIFMTACSNNSDDPNVVESESNEVTAVDSDDSQTRIVTDMAGREVEVKKDIERVVTTSWDSADVLVTILGEEAMDSLVAVGTTKSAEIVKELYAEQYPQIAEMPNIGGGRGSAYDVEMIASLKPDVFIINATSVDTDLVDDLEKVGIPSIVLTMAAEPMKTPQEAIKLVGELFDKDERAKEITDFIDEQFALIQSKNLSEKENKPTIYMEKGSGNSEEYDVAFTSKEGWGGIMEFTGAENIIKDTSGSSVQVDPEYLITEDPDFIIIAGGVGWDGGKGGKAADVLDEYSKRKGWDSLSAVENGNFYALSHEQSRNQMCFFPSLFMAKTFYPEEFEDLDPTARLKEFYDRFMLLDFERGVWSTHREAL